MFQFIQIMTQKHKKYVLDSKLKRKDKISIIKPYDLRLKYGCAICYNEFNREKVQNEKV